MMGQVRFLLMYRTSLLSCELRSTFTLELNKLVSLSDLLFLPVNVDGEKHFDHYLLSLVNAFVMRWFEVCS